MIGILRNKFPNLNENVEIKVCDSPRIRKLFEWVVTTIQEIYYCNAVNHYVVLLANGKAIFIPGD